MMTQYSYLPLDGIDTIRILELDPDEDEDGVLCGSIETFHLGASDTPPFETLSYAWGDPSKVAILETPDGDISITRSLESALRDLRHEEFYLRLWVDAICINQDDHQEKNSQVRLMSKIYSSARGGMVYLGPEADNSLRAIQLVDYLSTLDMEKEIGSGSYRKSWLDNRRMSRVPPFPDEGWPALRAILRRPWFRRLWVIQEFVLGKSVWFMCGREWKCPWTKLWNPLESLMDYNVPGLLGKSSDDLETWQQTMRGWDCFRLGERGQVTLLGIAASIPVVWSHYNFESLIVAGQETSAYQYVRRTTNSNSPQQDVTSVNMRCNTGGNDATIRAATQTYQVAAGTVVGFKMNEYIGHPGPLSVYMSKAPSGTTAQNYLGDGNWFKVYQLTTATETSDGITWASFVGGGIRNFTFTLPSALPAGEYLMRGEHIATHGAQTFGGSQFYIGCAQLKVTGSGSGSPAPVVKFPGAYTGREPGILYNPYWPPVLNYTVPGPVTWPGACVDHTANLNGQAYDGDCTPLRR